MPMLPAARSRVHELLRSTPDRSRQQLWVRVNALSSGLLLEDLAAVMADAGEGGPDGIVVPKVAGPAEVEARLRRGVHDGDAPGVIQTVQALIFHLPAGAPDRIK